MQLGWIILIVVVIIILVTVSIVLIVVFTNNSNGDPKSGNLCSTQNDCSKGYICVTENGTQVCKAGFGVSCNVNGDCAKDLVCKSRGGSKAKVCLNNTAAENSVKAASVLNLPRPVAKVEVKVKEEVRAPVVIAKVETKQAFKQLPRGVPLPPGNYSLSSCDDSQNSDGSGVDQPFEVRSGDSFEDRSVSTPCREKNGIYYCRNNKVPVLSAPGAETTPCSSPVVDVCSYSNATVFLLADGTVTVEVKFDESSSPHRYRAVNNVTLARIFTFDGYLYGLSSSGKLYNLPNGYFSTGNWLWLQSTFAVNLATVTSASATYDGKNLWLQTALYGYLYGEKGVLLSQSEFVNKRRVYGKNLKHFVDLDTTDNTAVVSSGKKLTNIFDAALSYYDEVIPITLLEKTVYRGVKVVDWKVFYLRTCA